MAARMAPSRRFYSDFWLRMPVVVPGASLRTGRLTLEAVRAVPALDAVLFARTGVFAPVMRRICPLESSCSSQNGWTNPWRNGLKPL